MTWNKKPKVSAELFIRVWQTAESAVDAAWKLGLKRANARGRARNYRRMGIPLRRFSSVREPISVEAMTSLARSMEKAPRGRS